MFRLQLDWPEEGPACFRASRVASLHEDEVECGRYRGAPVFIHPALMPHPGMALSWTAEERSEGLFFVPSGMERLGPFSDTLFGVPLFRSC